VNVTLPDGSPEEFNKDCSTTLQDLANASPHSVQDQQFAYADVDIDALSMRLGIQWKTLKLVPFGTEVPYLGLHWDLHTQVIHLLDEKRVKYLGAIAEWEAKRTHNLLETQKLYGKLLHASLVILPGCAYLTSLEAMLASFNSSPFIPHTPPQDTPSNLEWWK